MSAPFLTQRSWTAPREHPIVLWHDLTHDPREQPFYCYTRQRNWHPPPERLITSTPKLVDSEWTRQQLSYYAADPAPDEHNIKSEKKSEKKTTTTTTTTQAVARGTAALNAIKQDNTDKFWDTMTAFLFKTLILVWKALTCLPWILAVLLGGVSLATLVVNFIMRLSEDYPVTLAERGVAFHYVLVPDVKSWPVCGG